MTKFDAAMLADGAEWFSQVLLYPEQRVDSGQAAPLHENTGLQAPAAQTQITPAIIVSLFENPDDLCARREGVMYCSLFDVGKPEPAAPLQEGFYHNDPHTRLRRVVNFYRYYDVSQQTNWASDHLCVELYFLAYLLRLSAAYPGRADLQEAVRSFARLHLGSFVHQCLQRVRQADTTGIYYALFEGLCRYLTLVGVEQRIELAVMNSPVDGANQDA